MTNSNDRYDELLGDVDKWESRELGADKRYAKRGRSREAIDEKLGLKKISIRLQEELLEDFKEFAECDGIGYQPLIRQVLNRYAHARRAESTSARTDLEGPQSQA